MASRRRVLCWLAQRVEAVRAVDHAVSSGHEVLAISAQTLAFHQRQFLASSKPLLEYGVPSAFGYGAAAHGTTATDRTGSRSAGQRRNLLAILAKWPH